MTVALDIISAVMVIVWCAFAVFFGFHALRVRGHWRGEPHFGWLHAALLAFVIAQLVRIAS